MRQLRALVSELKALGIIYDDREPLGTKYFLG